MANEIGEQFIQDAMKNIVQSMEQTGKAFQQMKVSVGTIIPPKIPVIRPMRFDASDKPSPKKIKRTTKPTQSTPRKVKRHG